MEESKRAKKHQYDTFGVPCCRSGGRARVTEKELKSARAGVSTFQSGRGSALARRLGWRQPRPRRLGWRQPWPRQRQPWWRRYAVENRGRFSAKTALCSLDTCTALRHHKHQVHHYRCHMDIDPDLRKIILKLPKQRIFQCCGILVGITNRHLEEFHYRCHMDTDPDLEK